MAKKKSKSNQQTSSAQKSTSPASRSSAASLSGTAAEEPAVAQKPIVDSAAALFARRFNGRTFLQEYLGLGSEIGSSSALTEKENAPSSSMNDLVAEMPAASPSFLQQQRIRNVRDYLQKVPRWDRKPRIKQLFQRWRTESLPGPSGRCRKNLDTARALRRAGNEIYRQAALSMQQSIKDHDSGSRQNALSIQLPRTQQLDSQSALAAFGQLTRACAEYVAAMMYAPQDSEEYALAVANRSAIHFETLNYAACIRDIEEALRSGYPISSKHKLLRRRALCYAHALASLLADDGKSDSNGDFWAPRRSRMLPGNSPRRVCEELQNTLKEIQVICSDKQFLVVCKQEFDDWTRVFADNNAAKAMEAMKKMHRLRGIVDDSEIKKEPAMNYTTELVRFANIPDRGRSVVAKTNLKKDTPIMVEHALCAIPLRTDAMRCEYCLRSEPLSAIPCPNCVGVMFCSRKCMELSDHCHSLCCREQAMVEDLWENAVLALHIFDSISNGKNQQSLKKEMEQLVYSENMSTSYVFYMSVTTSMLGQYLQLSIDQQMQLFSCLGRVCSNSVVIKSSGFSPERPRIIEGRKKSVDVIEEDLLGIGLYRDFSRFNHSCSPNSGYSFTLEVNQTPMVVVCTEKNIEAKHELTISYGPLAKNMIKSVRQRALQERYSFECKCEACSGMHDMAMSYQCWHCSHRLTDISEKCPVCETKIDWELYKKIETCADNLIEEGSEHLCALVLHDAMSLRKKIYHRQTKPIAAVHDLLAFVYSSKQDFRRALYHCEKSLRILNQYYAPDEPEFVREQCKLINIYQQLGRFDLLLQLIAGLKPLVKRLFGEKDTDYIDMVQSEKFIRDIGLASEE